MFSVHRLPHNPIITPSTERAWDSFASFNPCPIKEDGVIKVVYRSMVDSQVIGNDRLPFSIVGSAESRDGKIFKNYRRLIVPENDWERYGCEDPRITKMGNKYFIFYTALGGYPFSAANIKVAVAVTRDLNKIERKHLVTPFNAKAMVLFPEKINGKYYAILSVDTDALPAKMGVASFFREEDLWSPDYWKVWYSELDKHSISLKRRDSDHVEVGAPPIKTPKGWLLIYSHIQNYLSNDKIFGIEAVLLDLNDPKKIIGRTRGSIMVPEESYEEFGQTPNVIFPTGSFIDNGYLYIYYGSADTSGSAAKIKLSNFLDSMSPDAEAFVRYPHNPILEKTNYEWENNVVFNPGAVRISKKTHLFYRAMSKENTSSIGYASTEDGLSIDERLEFPVYDPREPFEFKTKSGGNSGSEDPRITVLGNRAYMLYTAYDGSEPPKIALTSISLRDLKNKEWNWSKSRVISNNKLDDKDACLFPEKIKGKYVIMHRVYNHICVDYLSSLDSGNEILMAATPIIGPRKGMWDGQKVGISTPPIKTSKGWFALYHGIDSYNVYRVGAVLLDLKDPSIVISRTSDFIFEPKKDYEKNGPYPNVVFPCGTTIDENGTMFVYYGAADQSVCVASAKFEDVLKLLV